MAATSTAEFPPREEFKTGELNFKDNYETVKACYQLKVRRSVCSGQNAVTVVPSVVDCSYLGKNTFNTRKVRSMIKLQR